MSSADNSPEREALSEDLIFDVLKNRRRRYTLHYLKQQERPVELSELAEQVAAWENDTTVEGLSANERKSVYTSLYQTHLPKLADAGIVEYNQNRGVVELSGNAAQLEGYLRPQDEFPWIRYYLGLATVSAVLVISDLLGVPPFEAIPDEIWGVLIVAAFAVSALAHYVRRRQLSRRERPPNAEG
jgi:DNA-binding transcriptional ArsR family regulator